MNSQPVKIEFIYFCGSQKFTPTIMKIKCKDRPKTTHKLVIASVKRDLRVSLRELEVFLFLVGRLRLLCDIAKHQKPWHRLKWVSRKMK